MQFIFDGKFYKAIKVSGPMHNMLGLVLDKDKLHDIEIIALRSKIDQGDNVSALNVKDQVMSAIKTVNKEFGVKYTIEKIQFVPSDSPSDSVYRELTVEIIKRLIEGGKFNKV
jgi:hypothetical protein